MYVHMCVRLYLPMPLLLTAQGGAPESVLVSGHADSLILGFSDADGRKDMLSPPESS